MFEIKVSKTFVIYSVKFPIQGRINQLKIDQRISVIKHIFDAVRATRSSVIYSYILVKSEKKGKRAN